MDFFNDHAVLFALICSGVGIALGVYFTWWLLQQPAGSERMQEIARAIQEGAAAYLKRQYRAIAIVSIVPFLLLGLYDQLGWGTAIGFLVGAVLSASAGFIGMNVAVRSNVRTAEAAKSGLTPALNVAFRAGSVTGLLVVGLGLFGVAGYYGLLTEVFDVAQDDAIDDLVGLAFGGSLISVFARHGGHGQPAAHHAAGARYASRARAARPGAAPFAYAAGVLATARRRRCWCAMRRAAPKRPSGWAPTRCSPCRASWMRRACRICPRCCRRCGSAACACCSSKAAASPFRASSRRAAWTGCT